VIFGILTWSLIEHGDPALQQKLPVEAVDVLSRWDHEGEVVEPRALSVEASPPVRTLGLDDPDVAGVGHRTLPAAVIAPAINPLPAQPTEEGVVERIRSEKVGDAKFDVVKARFQQK
jgi:hypothetical protein